MNRVLVFTHPLFGRHQTGPGHPECPERLEAIEKGIEQAGLRDRLDRGDPLPVDPGCLCRVHDSAYVERMLALEGSFQSLDGDTFLSPESIPAALRGAGAVVQGVDAVLSGKYEYAVSLARPPGHHATPNRAMGFCVFNHAATAAAHALAAHGLERVLIFDPDVHHGNGTQDIFYESKEVLYFSIHQSPLFPGTGLKDETGAGEGKGYTFNVPLPAGMVDADYLHVLDRLLSPVIDRFSPQLALVSAGFDAHEYDPLGGMNLTTSGFRRLYENLFEALAARDCPVVLVLEGGYSLEALREVVPGMLEACLGERIPPARKEDSRPGEASVQLVEAFRESLIRHPDE